MRTPIVRFLRLGTAALLSVALFAGCASSPRARGNAEYERLIASPEAARATVRADGYPFTVEKITINVPENRGAVDSATLALPVIRWRAIHPDGSPPLFLLNGGPGFSNMNLGLEIELAERRDIVLVGYRGIDGTRRLTASAGYRVAVERLLARPTPATYRNLLTALAKNAAELRAAGVDLAGYSIEEAVEDVEEARRALGFDVIDVYGVSFGTRIAQAYAARHTEAVGRLVLFLAAPQGDFYGAPGSFPASLEAFAASAGAAPGRYARTIAALAESPEGRLRLAACHGALRSKDSAASAIAALDAFEAGNGAALDALTAGFLAGHALPGVAMMQRYLMFGSLPALAAGAPDLFAASALDVAGRPLYVMEDYLACLMREAAGIGEAPAAVAVSSSLPTLIIAGSLDPFDPADRARTALLPLYSWGTLLVIEDAAHEQIPSAGFMALVDQFLVSSVVETRLLPPGGFRVWP